MSSIFFGIPTRRWWGHSTLVAQKHYWQLTDSDFEPASGLACTSTRLKLTTRKRIDVPGVLLDAQDGGDWHAWSSCMRIYSARFRFLPKDHWTSNSKVHGLAKNNPMVREQILKQTFDDDQKYLQQQSPLTVAEKNAAAVRGKSLIRVVVGDRD